MTDYTDLIARLRFYADDEPDLARDDMREAADALEAQGQKIEELRNALACELDDTQNACGALNAEIDRLKARLAEAEALLAEAERELLDAGYEPDRIWLRPFLNRISAFLGKKP